MQNWWQVPCKRILTQVIFQTDPPSYLCIMNLEYKHLLPKDFAPESRVWVYQSSRLFSLQEALQIEGILESFVAQWKAHGDPVKGFATLFFGRFIILMADETHTGVSGCSTDSSVRMVKGIESTFGVSMFDRQQLAFIRNEKIEPIPMGQFDYAINHGMITPDTLFFNNVVLNKLELETKWIVPVKESWLARRLKTPV